jgi:hypothetical protein
MFLAKSIPTVVIFILDCPPLSIDRYTTIQSGTGDAVRGGRVHFIREAYAAPPSRAATIGGHHMKMLLTVEFPLEPFNSLVRSGKAGEIIGRILETIKPESAYFTEHDGKRGGIFVINVNNASDVPFFAEPFFLKFQASCKFRILMSPEDLQKAGLEELGKKWG